MPRISKTGQLLGGNFGKTTSINNVPLVPNRCCGGWQWLDIDNPMGQVCDQFGCRLLDSKNNLIDSEGANYLVAGSHRWAAVLISNDIATLRSNFGIAGTNMFPLAASFEGDVAILFGYNSGSQQIKIYLFNGNVIEYDITMTYVLRGAEVGASLKNGLFTVIDKNLGWRIFDYNINSEISYLKLNDTDTLTACICDKGIVLLERLLDSSLRVRLANANTGKIVARNEGIGRETCQPDIVSLNNGSLLRIAWGFTQGEEPHEYTSIDLLTDELIDTPVPPSYNPKDDLIHLRSELDSIISKL